MEYNTQREQLKINDYGRCISKLIDYAKAIEDRDERTKMAHHIVETMALVNPKIKERTDYRRILWDHLMIIANFELDVDCPYPISRPEVVEVHPHPIKYSDSKIRYRHYGRALEDMIRAVAEMPEGEEKNLLSQQIAHTMKRQYLQWNRDSVDDDLIREQLSELSGGRITLPADFQFRDSKIYIDAMAAAAAKKESNAKKKKKKKKQNAQS
ncbi:MAG: DUF4290 domain-containing protein [Bacteroidales bacterium]|nr:DUF4290 domain-containing protein [Bacteroidales bacterium]